MSVGKESIVSAAVEFESSNGKDVIMCLKYEGDARIENHKFHLADYGLNEDENYNEVLGFITNKNRFVDPQEAAHIALDNDQVDDVNKLWNVFAKQKNEKDRNRMQEIIYEKTTLMLRSGLKPEDLY